MPTDDERIKRIARALCRAERIDPDKPLDTEFPLSLIQQRPVIGALPPAWMLYRSRAEAFVARNRDIVATL